MSETTAEANGAIAEIKPVTIAPTSDMRCGRCNGQAYVEVELIEGGRLEFCAHHFRKHEDALIFKAKRIIDYRSTLRNLEGDDRR